MVIRVALVGWNGRMNAGDDAMSAAFVSAIRSTAPDAEISAYADHDALPYELVAEGVRGIRHFNAFLGVRGLRGAIMSQLLAPHFIRKSCPDLLIFGGGSILKSSKTIAHFLEIIRLARGRNPETRIIGVSVSLGPFETPQASALCARFLSECDAVIVRDSRSLEVARSLGPARHVSWQFDAALAYCHSATRPTKRTDGQKVILGIGLRARADEAQQARVVHWLSRLDPRQFNLKFISMSSNRRYDDAEFARSFLPELRDLNPKIVPYSSNLRNMFCELEGCNVVLAVRLHAMIFASALGKPVLFYPYDKKLNDFGHDLNLESIRQLPGDFEHLDPSTVLKAHSQKRSAFLNAIIESSAMASHVISAELRLIQTKARAALIPIASSGQTRS